MHRPVLLVIVLAVLSCCGCGSYQLAGVIVESTSGSVEVISQSDNRATKQGISGASLELTLDPTSMSPKTIAIVTTDADGRFKVDVDELGAGFLKYRLAILGQAEGYKTHYQEISMPPNGKLLYITLEAGKDQYRPPSDLLHDTLKIGNDLLKTN